MASERTRWLPDVVRQCLPLTGRRARSNPPPLSSPVHDNNISPGVVFTQAVSAPSPPAMPCGTGAAQNETSPAIAALRVVLGELRDKLNELPPLQIAVGVLLECITDVQVEERNRQEYDELAFDLANLATIIQNHDVGSKTFDGPYSIDGVVRAIGEQAQQIKTQQERSRMNQSTTDKDNGEAILKSYRRIKALFEQLQTNILQSESQDRDMSMRLKDLCPAYDAYHDAALPTSVTRRVRCTQNTRVALLETAHDWACDENGIKILWLNGMAGTGKTTIAYTLCEMLQRSRLLGASFFCSRNSPDCRDANRIVPTIAYQLGRYSSSFRQVLCDALRSDPDASKRKIASQFEHLIAKPFAKMGQGMPRNIIVVIDALDECSDEAGAKDVLNVLIQHAADLPIRFFIASRPEPAISKSMTAPDGATRSIFWLHDIEKSLVQADITLYLTEALASIQISPSEIDQLAARAGNLFIFAATAVRYISPDTGTVNNRKRLQEVLTLRSNQKSRSYRDIDNLYATILANALDEEMYSEDELITRRRVLWTVVCGREPLTIKAHAEILHTPDDEEVRLAVESLQSVLYVSESSSVVSALHASFPDFLLSRERAGPFHCDEALQSSYLAECCFKLMDRSLKFNICGLESSYILDRDIPDLQCRVNKTISTGLFYSCRYWGDHLTRSPPSSTLLSFLHVLLQQHLLFWMEVLNLKGRIGHGEAALSQGLTWLPIEDEWAELRDFAYDARNFVTMFAASPVSLSTPHIYVSVLPFTPRQSRVRKTYWGQAQGLIEIEGAATEGRGKSRLATWIAGETVLGIARSSDGRYVASGSDGAEVSVWDLSSGTYVLGPLEGHMDAVQSVAFSPDDSRIASGSLDHTIRVWDAHNGNLVLGPLCGHTLDIFSVAFSPDGNCIASGSDDRTIRLWDAHTGITIGDPYRGHRNTVESVAFSPDGQHFASASSDGTIRVWNWQTGKAALGPIKGQTGSVRCIAYSPDGLRLASGSSHGAVQVWDMSSGALLAGSFNGHTASVVSVSFSPNGAQIVSGSYDCTIQVWETGSGRLLAGPSMVRDREINQVLFTTDGTRILSGSGDGLIDVWDARQGTTGPTESFGCFNGIRSVAMSPDGTRAASGSGDRTICVWDMHNGTLVAGPFEGHTYGINSVAFSPDGARIVSGSDDYTLCTWDASTGASLAGPFRGHTNLVYSVAFSPDGRRVASGSLDRTIRLWDSYTGELVTEPFEGHTETVKAVAFSPNGAHIVSGSDDRTVCMWDANDGTVLWASRAHTGYVRCVAFSPDGRRVVSGSRDKSILVLNTNDGAVLHGPFTGHTHWVHSVAFSPDGTRIVSSSRDKTVRVWDMASGTVVVGPLKGHTDEVRSAAFSPDGARIVSGSSDGTIRLWDVSAAAQPNTASFDGWSIDDDGWLTDSQSQRLFWVPSDLHHGFWFPTPSNSLIIGARNITCVNNTTLLGDRWHECYGPSV